MPSSISRVSTPVWLASANDETAASGLRPRIRTATAAPRPTACARALTSRAATKRAAAQPRARSTPGQGHGHRDRCDDGHEGAHEHDFDQRVAGCPGGPRAQVPAARPPTPLRCDRPRAGDGHERLELEKALLADAAHVHQVFGLLEAAVLLAVLDDPLGGGPADPGQRLELRDRRGVEVERGAAAVVAARGASWACVCAAAPSVITSAAISTRLMVSLLSARGRRGVGAAG